MNHSGRLAGGVLGDSWPALVLFAMGGCFFLGGRSDTTGDVGMWGIFLGIMVFSVNLVGDGLRDALDPRAIRRA